MKTNNTYVKNICNVDDDALFAAVICIHVSYEEKKKNFITESHVSVTT